MNEPPFARHAWLLFIGVTVANALILKFRSRAYIHQQPELAAGYQQLFKGVLLLGNLPWVVMGIGIVFGGVPNVFSYFRPRDGNPFVIALFGVVIILWILGFYWLFARRGAEFLIKHPGLLRGNPKSPTMIRLVYCLMVAAGVAATCAMYFANIPTLAFIFTARTSQRQVFRVSGASPVLTFHAILHSSRRPLIFRHSAPR